jgi:hypothetical protein
LTGLLDGPQTGDDGIEEVEQDQGGVLIVVQDAVTGAIASAAGIVQLLHHGKQQLEVLEAVEVLLLNVGSCGAWHTADSMRQAQVWRK